MRCAGSKCSIFWIKDFTSVEMRPQSSSNKMNKCSNHTIIIDLAYFHLVEDFFLITASKWWVPAQEYVENHTTWPNIAFLVVVLVEHFRSDVVWLLIGLIVQTVPNFFVMLLAVNLRDVPKSMTLRLDSLLSDTKMMFSGLRSRCTIFYLKSGYSKILMAINNSQQYLPKKICSPSFTEIRHLLDSIEELTSWEISSQW